jgi:Pheophorbide a oxygenase
LLGFRAYGNCLAIDTTVLCSSGAAVCADNLGAPSKAPVDDLFEGRIRDTNRFYTIPVTATTSRLITRAELYRIPAGLKRFIEAQPVWMRQCFMLSEILDGDMLFLHRQSLKIHNKKLSPKEYFTPAACDMGVTELWKFLRKHSKGGINYYPHVADTAEKPPEEVLDRFTQHVKNCSHCQKAFKQIEVRATV